MRVAMRALYAARLEDLGPDDRVKVECAACKHVSRIAVTGLGLPASTAVLDLKIPPSLPRLRRSRALYRLNRMGRSGLNRATRVPRRMRQIDAHNLAQDDPRPPNTDGASPHRDSGHR